MRAESRESLEGFECSDGCRSSVRSGPGALLGFEVVLVWAAAAGDARVAWPWLLVAPGMLMFMISLVRLGGWLSQRDEARIVAFLRSRLGGSVENPDC